MFWYVLGTDVSASLRVGPSIPCDIRRHVGQNIVDGVQQVVCRAFNFLRRRWMSAVGVRMNQKVTDPEGEIHISNICEQVFIALDSVTEHQRLAVVTFQLWLDRG
jgi:hypothetical protein